ncbi:MAG: PAS domain S-box protein [Fluviicola sp.]
MQPLLSHVILDQNKDLIWVIDKDFQLIYGNTTYFSFMKDEFGIEKKLNEPAFIDTFGKEDVEKWKSNYSRALKGESFELEESHLLPESHEVHYSQTSFLPLLGEKNEVIAVSCQSRDITRIVKLNLATNKLLDTALDVFCSIDEAGNFVHVSAAAFMHWGYTSEELFGKPYISFVLEEDIPKTNQIAADIISGKDVNVFSNRYTKKDGGIAYNLWSARWDNASKLMYCVARDGKEKLEQEQKIQQSEQRFKALVQEGADLIGILDTDGNYTYVSPTSTSILGINPEEFIGKNAFEFIHHDDTERVLECLKRITTEKIVSVEPFRFKNNTNEWRWVETVLTNMLDNPAVSGIVANSRDITEKIATEEKNKLVRQRFESLVENSMDCIVIISPEGKTTYVSGSIKKILGYSPQEVMDINIWELCHPDDIAPAEAVFAQSFENPGVTIPGHISRIKHKNGTWRWIEPVVTNLLHDPAVNGFVDNFRDITDKVEEQKRLKLLESVTTNAKDAILITEIEPLDEPGPRIIYANEAFTKMTGYTADEVIGKTPRMLQGPNSNKEELGKLGRALRNWESFETTIINYKKNGEEFWINFNVTPVADGSGLFTHFISIQHDVTEMKMKELEKDLLHQISDIFHKCVDNELKECLTNLCQCIAGFGDFDFAEIWLPAIDSEKINRVSQYAANKSGKDFYKESKKFDTCRLGEGMPGYVWKKKATEIWTPDDEKWHLSNTRKAAEKAHIETLVGIPLKHKDEVIGVLLVGTKKNKSALALYIEMFKKIKLSIGAELSRKKVEIELAQIFNSTPDMICVAGFDGYLKRINPAGLNLMGYSLEEMCSQPIVSFIHKEDRKLTQKTQKGLYAGGNIRNFENRYITKQGEIVWLNWTATSDLEQHIVYAVAKNITEEKKLRELNKATRSIAKIGSWEFDLLNNQVYWSDEVHQMHDTDPDTFVPEVTTGITFYRKDFRDLVATKFEKCIKLGEPFDFEAVIITTKKKELWVRVIGNAEFINGECSRIYGSFQNIQDLKEAGIKLQSFASNLPGVALQYHMYPDGTGNITYATNGAKYIWGFSAEEVIQNDQLIWDCIKAGGDFEEVNVSIINSIENKTKWTSKFRYVMPSGEIRVYFASGTPNFLEDETIEFNSIILDITQEVKNEDLIIQASNIARIGSWEMDLLFQNRGVMYWSPIIKEMLGFDQSYTPTYSGSLELFVGEHKERIENAVTNLIHNGIEFDEELLLNAANEETKWVRIIGKSEIANGKRIKVYGSLQDIDDRKKSQIELTNSENKLRTILEAEPECVKLMDEQGKILMMNPAGIEMIEADDETQILNQSVQQIILPEHRSAFLNLIKSVFRGESGKLIFEIRGLKGTHRWMETHAVPMKNEKGEITSLLGVTRDITEQMESQKEMIESEEKRRLIMTGALDAIICIEPNQEITFWNPQAEVLFGWKESEALGQLLPQLIIPEAFRKFHEEGVKNYIQTGNEKVLNRLLELTAVRRNGEVFPIELTVIPIKQGDALFFCAFIRDISQRKKAEAEKNSLITTLENSLNEIYIFSKETLLFSYVNKGALNNLGYSEQEIKELTPININPGFTEESFRELSDPLILKEKEKIVFLAKHERKDGSVYPVEVHLQLVTDHGDVRFLAVVLNITERLEAEQYILKANERFEKVTEATNDAIWDWDIENNVFYRSKAIGNFFGKEVLNEMKEENFWKDDFHPEDVARIKHTVQAAIANPAINRWESEYRIFNSQGKIVYVIDRGIIVRNKYGKAIRMVGAMTDVTSQKQLEIQLNELNISLQERSFELERSNEELEQFAFIASHDLQEPLRMISSFMDLLKRKYEGRLDEKALKYIFFATDGARRMKQIILDILDFSRAGKLNEDLIPIDINQIVEEYKMLRRKIIKEKNVTVLSDQLPVVTSFRAPIVQTIHCLLDNAITYSKSDVKPQIEIRASENDVEWIIQVKDNGIGIDNSYFEKIFTIFQRLHDKDQYSGTGIGLSIAKKNIESCNGRIWVESVLNEGSTFYFTINK